MIGNFDIVVLISSDSGKNVNSDYVLGKHFDSSYTLLTKDKIYAYISSLESDNISRKNHSGIVFSELSRKNLILGIKKIASKIHSKKLVLGLDFEKTSISQQKRIAKLFNDALKKRPYVFKDASNIFSDLRQIKREDELDSIRKACSLSDEVFNCTVQWLSKNRTASTTESDVVSFMKKMMIDLGVEESFPIIVASGKNASCPHHIPQGILLPGFCIIDFGIKYNGYCSDMTRTIFVGTPNKKDIEIYEFLLDIQEKALDKITDNSSLESLDAAVRKGLGEKAKLFIHSLGHGVGLEVHERPFFNLDKKFLEGMVIAIEPGIYQEGKNSYGIRIEDMVLVRKKSEILTKASKALVFV